MTTLGYVMEGFIAGCLACVMVYAVHQWRREDRERAARADSWNSIMRVEHGV